MKTYFGFGIAPSMFPANCSIRKEELSPEAAGSIVSQGIVPCLNPSHQASIEAMRSRFGISVEVPAKAPQVLAEAGDRVLVMGVFGLPRLEGRHEYTPEEIEKAKFAFSLWTVS